MSGTTLSRWTMAYFAAALAALLVAEGLLAVGYGYPAAPIGAPATLVVVHLMAIGWLSLLMCGALFQFVPVLVARPLHSNDLPLPTLGLLLAGLAALLAGFLELDGRIATGLPLLPVGGALLAAGFLLAAYNLGRTLWPGRPLPLPARFVTVGLASLVATVGLGLSFTLVLGGLGSAAPLVALLTSGGVSIHAAAGLGGWLTLTAIGVSYRLLSMFMLAPEAERTTSRLALWGGAAVLALAILGGTAAILAGWAAEPVLVAASVLSLPVFGLYGSDVVLIFRQRKRRKIETNSRMAALALLSLAGAVVLGAVLLATGQLPRHAGALVYLVGFGWLTGLGLSQLYKIVAFVTWLECYGPILGRKPTPRVQDLVTEPRAEKWFYLYFAAVWLATGALLLGAAGAFRALVLLSLGATIGLILEYLRTRRLADVDPATRLPEGTRRPRLLYAQPPS